MKLVLCYTMGDGCSWHQDIVLPIEYDFEEDLICDFDLALTKAVSQGEQSFIFGTEEFEVKYFISFYPFHAKNTKKILPDIYTLENWFSQNNIYP